MYKISKVPKITYLNDEIKILSNLIYHDLTNIILEYFYKCHACNYYFDENSIEKCKCRTWCNYCSQLYTILNFCNNCKGENNNDDFERFIKCYNKLCENDAIYGNELYPFYCHKHLSDKLLISYYFSCEIENCTNTAHYLNDQLISLCYEHKDDKCNFFYKEGYGYTDETSEMKCYNCKNNIVVKYVCNCGIIRCSKCTMSNNFLLKDQKILACNKCICNFDTNRDQCSNITLDELCEVNDCEDYPSYYDPIYIAYFCDYHHSPKNCVKMTKRCKYKNCLAICYLETEYCHYHHLELIKYNTS
jgi:hypothetical protein